MRSRRGRSVRETGRGIVRQIAIGTVTATRIGTGATATRSGIATVNATRTATAVSPVVLARATTGSLMTDATATAAPAVLGAVLLIVLVLADAVAGLQAHEVATGAQPSRLHAL
ncbi:hypothetical protein BD311DRAFT_764611 [Dichomitus squalens]|uniref:Uncharacterized protein n=1 Tax=Dichomitus squalens TaxID=114155 RepID=A0A4Q9MHS8_9APHY|nr:hypothetical protein BD311DRAFT_764611 [Dichomitus squalens]